jgi:parallel beta-helix repeat protein
MLTRVILLSLLAAAVVAAQTPAASPVQAPAVTPTPVEPTAGMLITRSTTLKPGTYPLPSAGFDAPALVVRGDNITLDLTGVTLEGGEALADPDTYTGVGVLVDGGANVTIRGGTIRGYKVGIRAQKASKLHVTGTDVSYNWKQHLRSGIEHENQADWMSYHQNEKDEWLRYGAGIYLTDCDTCEIDHTRVVQGENGLMATRSSHLKIWNNVYSWNSAIGIGFYRTTDSIVMHNKLDWDVRGYSHGFYNRGQDSSAMLMYEQSSRNQIAFNSATHGGDGLFLWAGQSTMDTGEGGANDNVFVQNDFSHAVANGIEATFSRNVFANNRVDDCWHGVWGGYSYDSSFTGNSFTGNTDAIAIEHGQNNVIANNTFKDNETAIRLWANLTQDPTWGYAKKRDTKSRDYQILGNTFDNNKTDLNALRTFNVTLKAEGAVAPTPAVHPLPGAMSAMLPEGARRGRNTIIVDEWGPYDFKSPKLWPSGRLSDRPLKLRVLGPAGQWTLKAVSGATLSKQAGVVPDDVVVTPAGPGADLRIDLEYVGGTVVSPRGQVTPPGQPYVFSYMLFDPAIDWTVRFWKFDVASDPLAHLPVFEAMLATAPVRTEKAPRLDYPSAQSFGEGFADHIAIIADGVVTLAPGNYELLVTSDDGVKVWIDDKLVAEDWSIHGAKDDVAPLNGGRHRVRIEYFQNTGSAALQAQIRRK